MDSPLDISADQRAKLVEVLAPMDGSATLDKVDNLPWADWRTLSIQDHETGSLHLIREDGTHAVFPPRF